MTFNFDVTVYFFKWHMKPENISQLFRSLSKAACLRAWITMAIQGKIKSVPCRLVNRNYKGNEDDEYPIEVKVNTDGFCVYIYENNEAVEYWKIENGNNI